MADCHPSVGCAKLATGRTILLWLASVNGHLGGGGGLPGVGVTFGAGPHATARNLTLLRADNPRLGMVYAHLLFSGQISVLRP